MLRTYCHGLVNVTVLKSSFVHYRYCLVFFCLFVYLLKLSLAISDNYIVN